MVTFLAILSIAWPTLASIVIIAAVLLVALQLLRAERTGPPSIYYRSPRV